jgi:hypothetical protein
VERSAHATGTYVGHYGCELGDRIVRVRLPRDNHGRPHWQATWEILCPACGTRHRVRPMWRRANHEEKRAAEVVLYKRDMTHAGLVSSRSTSP